MSEIKSEHTTSPGNDFSPAGLAVPPMRMPHLDFVYRIVCDMDPAVSEIRNAGGTGSTRLVLPILRGTVRGPRIKGEIVERSGADWAERVRPDKVWPTIDQYSYDMLARLNARYTLRTDDGVYILVNAHGICRAGPGRAERVAPTMSQDDVEYFTHITFEAPGDSAYDWMNGILALGVMTMFEGRPVIDCYRLTNFPGKPAEKL